MSFKISLSDTSIFKASFDAISTIVDEIICVIDTEGFRVTAIDRSHISFVSLDLKPTVFDEFDCPIPEKITIDTAEFMKILKRMKNSDVLELTLEENNLIIKFIGDADREFKLRLIDSQYDIPEPPVLETPVCVNIPSELVKDCLTDMALFSDKLDFLVDQDYFKVITDGEFGDASAAYIHGEEVNEVVKASYSIPKLQEMFKASKFSEMCEISLGNDMPLILTFKLISDDGQISFLLAPRLDLEE